MENKNIPFVVIKHSSGSVSWHGSNGTKLRIFLIGGGGSSYGEGGGGSGYIKNCTYIMLSEKILFEYVVGNGGHLKRNGAQSSITFPDGQSCKAGGGYSGGIVGDEGGNGWSGGGGDDGGKGGSNGSNGRGGHNDDLGGYGTHEELPKLKFVNLSPGAGGRGSISFSTSYDGGGGGGVLVNGTGPSIRKDTYDHESGEGYGAGGSHGYDGGDSTRGTYGLIIVETLQPGIV